MNKLPLKTRVQILSLLCEGSSMRSISRVADVSINTVSKLLVDAGKFCADLHDREVRNVKAKRVQCDEIWSFTAAKQKNVAAMKNTVDGAGDTWTWTALDSDSKLIISWLVGGRDGEYALAFMDDVRDRLANRVQLTTDGHKAYLNAVEEAFGADIDYAMLVKMYGEPEGRAVPQERRYSPAVCTGAKKTRIEGEPDLAHVSTSHVERQNLTYADAPLHASHQRVFKEVREPRAHGCALHCLVQLHPRSQDAENVTGNGRWRFQDALVNG
jgi:IS1 family transposase